MIVHIDIGALSAGYLEAARVSRRLCRGSRQPGAIDI